MTSDDFGTDGGADADLLDASQLLAGRTRRRAPHLLFLLESWSDRPGDDVFELLESTEAFTGMTREQLGDLLRPDLGDAQHPLLGNHVAGAGPRVELLELTDEVRTLVVAGADASLVDSAAIRAGMTTMMDDAVQKCRLGITAAPEVLRVTSAR